MAKLAVIKISGKQYLVENSDEIFVNRINQKEGSILSIDKLMEFDNEKTGINVGNPFLKTKTKAKILEHLQDEKIRIMTYKAKSRYRKTKGFRAKLTKIKITTL
jgi:large subunit ribosomal protein L21